MIQKVIKLSEYPLLSNLLLNGKTISAINKQNYYITLDQIKGKQIVDGHEYEADRNLGRRENTIELKFDTKEHKFFKLWNGTDGDKGLKGDKGPKGDQGESFNRQQLLRQEGVVGVLDIINNDESDLTDAVWSAYRGKLLEDFLKSIAEIVITDEEYQLLFNENENDTDEYGNKNEHHQIFIDMEFITSEKEQTVALVHTDTKKYKTYVKYWTYENETAESYFIRVNTGTNESPVYEYKEVLGFDLWNDLYLNPDNTETYYTRKLVITEVDPISGEIIKSEYVYTPIDVPVWLDLEFTTDSEDTTSILLTSTEISDDGDVSKEEQEEEIQILYRKIDNISFEGNKDITIPVNSIITKTINITPINYINAYIYIEYDSDYIKVYEDGRIMALNNPCPEGTIIKIYAKNKNDEGEYEIDNNIYDTLTIRVVVYTEDIMFDSYNIEGLKGTKYSLILTGDTETIIPENNKVQYYNIIPNTTSNKSIEWESSDSEVVDIILDENGNQTNELELLSEGEATIYAHTTDGSNVSSIFNIVVITPVNNIIVNETINPLVGYTTPINVTVLPENATHKELIWTIKDSVDEFDEFGNHVYTADDNKTGMVYATSTNEFTIIVTAKDGSYYSKEIRVVPKTGVSGIELNMNTITLDKGYSYQLEATIINSDVADNQNLEWITSNENVITVTQDGLITAVNGGTATITVRATDGSKAEASCEITSVILISQITLSLPNNMNTCNVGNTYPILYNIMPLNANVLDLTWYTSDETIATINYDKQLIALKEGHVKIYAVANDNSGVIGMLDVDVTVPTEELILVNDELEFNNESEEDKYYELTMNVDENFTVVSIVEPDNTSNQNLNYISMNTDIVTIDNNGNINSIASGTATIFINTTDGTNLSQKLKVNVL